MTTEIRSKYMWMLFIANTDLNFANILLSCIILNLSSQLLVSLCFARSTVFTWRRRCWQDGMSMFALALKIQWSRAIFGRHFFAAGLNMYQLQLLIKMWGTDNLWGMKMSLFLMLRQWQGRNGLFENRRGHFFGVNLKPSWNDDTLIRLDSLLNTGVNPTLLLIGQPTWAPDTFEHPPAVISSLHSSWQDLRF